MLFVGSRARRSVPVGAVWTVVATRTIVTTWTIPVTGAVVTTGAVCVGGSVTATRTVSVKEIRQKEKEQARLRAEHEAKAQRQSRVSISLGIGSPDSPLVGRMSNVFGGAGGEDLTQLWAKQAALTRTLEARVAQIDRLERAVRQMGGGGGGAGAVADDSGRGDWPPGAADDPLHA